jgi:hypothetical protein
MTSEPKGVYLVSSSWKPLFSPLSFKYAAISPYSRRVLKSHKGKDLMGFRFPKTWSTVWQNRPIRKFCSIKSTRPGPAIKQARAGGLGGLGFSPPSYAARARGEEDRAIAASPDPRSEPWRDQSATMSSQHQHRRRGEDKQVAALPPRQLIMGGTE